MTLATLQAQHPDWCFKCGESVLPHTGIPHFCAGDNFVIAALKEELEKAEAQLDAEQQAHAATKEELRKADGALFMAIRQPWLWGKDQEAVYKAARARHQARNAQGAEGGE